MAWGISSTVALDSQEAIQRTLQLRDSRAQSWIEGRLVGGRGGGKTLMWVMGQSRIAGNEVTDYKGKEAYLLAPGSFYLPFNASNSALALLI